MGKLNLTVDLDNLTEKEREEFFELVEKSKKKPLNPFERVQKKDKYYWIDCTSVVEDSYEYYGEEDNYCFDAHNYFNDEAFAERQALRELFNRKLIKFSYENGGADAEINNSYRIYYRNDCAEFDITTPATCSDLLSPLFISQAVAQRAIDEVIKPFLKEHPDFKWWG